MISVSYPQRWAAATLLIVLLLAATENRHKTTLQKTNDTSSSGVPLVYRAWGQLNLSAPSPFVAA